MKRIKISVTQELIDLGERGAASKCPVALAFIAAGFKRVSIAASRVWLVKKTAPKNLVADSDVQVEVLPFEVQNWIMGFDYMFPVEPIEFETELVP